MYERARRTILHALKSVHANIKFVKPCKDVNVLTLLIPVSMTLFRREDCTLNQLTFLIFDIEKLLYIEKIIWSFFNKVLQLSSSFFSPTTFSFLSIKEQVDLFS